MWLEVLTVVVVAIFVKFFLKSSTQRQPLPKGPDGEDLRPFTSIPGKQGLPIIGTLLELYWNDMAGRFNEWMMARSKQFGPIMKEYMMGQNMVLVSGVDMIEEVVKQDGKYPMFFSAEHWLDWEKRNKHCSGILTRF